MLLTNNLIFSDGWTLPNAFGELLLFQDGSVWNIHNSPPTVTNCVLPDKHYLNIDSMTFEFSNICCHRTHGSERRIEAF
jgi:hypothetical protein